MFMSTTTKAPPMPVGSKPEPVRYRMPAISVGEPVIFYPDADLSRPYPAFVTAVMEDHIDLSRFEKDAVNLEPLGGVRHVSDPALAKAEQRPNGAWDYSPT